MLTFLLREEVTMVLQQENAYVLDADRRFVVVTKEDSIIGTTMSQKDDRQYSWKEALEVAERFFRENPEARTVVILMAERVVFAI